MCSYITKCCEVTEKRLHKNPKSFLKILSTIWNTQTMLQTKSPLSASIFFAGVHVQSFFHSVQNCLLPVNDVLNWKNTFFLCTSALTATCSRYEIICISRKLVLTLEKHDYKIFTCLGATDSQTFQGCVEPLHRMGYKRCLICTICSRWLIPGRKLCYTRWNLYHVCQVWAAH